MGFHPTGSDRNAAGKLVQDPSERLRRVYWRFGWSCAAVQTLLGGNRVIVILPTYNMSSWSPACWLDRTVRPKRKKKHLIKKEKKRKTLKAAGAVEAMPKWWIAPSKRKLHILTAYFCRLSPWINPAHGDFIFRATVHSLVVFSHILLLSLFSICPLLRPPLILPP